MHIGLMEEDEMLHASNAKKETDSQNLLDYKGGGNVSDNLDSSCSVSEGLSKEP